MNHEALWLALKIYIAEFKISETFTVEEIMEIMLDMETESDYVANLRRN